jgi:hypothetical protein
MFGRRTVEAGVGRITSYPLNSWFETRGVATLLTPRIKASFGEAPTGPRSARPDDKLGAASNEEATELE